MSFKIYSNLRVYLSTLSIDDADEIAKNANDRDIAFNVGILNFPFPYERGHALKFIEGATEKMFRNEEMHFGIHLSEGGRLIGVEGYNMLDFNNKKGEIGYWLGREYWRKGYGKEAAGLLVSFGFNFLKLHRIEARVFDFNSASKALLEALGFSHECAMREAYFDGSKYHNEEIFSVLDRDYKNKLEINTEGALPYFEERVEP